jgi:molybdate transport system substrate-binding protein
MRPTPLPLCVALAACALAACTRHEGSGADAAPPPLRVAAASDLADSFAEVGDAFTKETGQRVSFSFAATGLLAKQIAEGAPFDVFAAANVAFIDDVVRAGACYGDTQARYATGRLAIWTKDGVPAAASLADLAGPAFVHVAIANPDHAPYGKAAKQALEKSGAWAGVGKKIVYGENVQQTLQFAQSGNAEAAIVADSLALAAEGGHASPVDSGLHAPIDQAIVACKGAASAGGKMEPMARRFAQFVASDAGSAILAKHGFGPPSDPVVQR